MYSRFLSSLDDPTVDLIDAHHITSHRSVVWSDVVSSLIVASSTSLWILSTHSSGAGGVCRPKLSMRGRNLSALARLVCGPQDQSNTLWSFFDVREA